MSNTRTDVRVITVVAAALIRADGAILLTQRPVGKAMAGLWEFPGGKLEDNETPEQALVRELKEEIGIVADPNSLEPMTFASHSYENFHLLMPLYVCRNWSGGLAAREDQNMEWVAPADLNDYPMPPADLPLIPLFQKGL